MEIRYLLISVFVTSLFMMNSQSSSFASELESEEFNFETAIREHVTIGGKVELQADWSENYYNEHDSDFSLSALEFDVLVQFAHWGNGKLVLEWDDDENKIQIDETYLIFKAPEKFPLFMKVGRYDLPFGAYEGNTISDPLTKEGFETKEDALLLGVELNGFYANTYLFDGETNKDRRNQFGGSLGYGIRRQNIKFSGGINYINSILDGNVFSENLESQDKSGFAAHAQLGMDDFAIFAEYITALESIDRYRPYAWQIECSYAFDVMEKETFVSLGYSQTDDFAGLLPKKRIAVTAGIELVDDLTLTTEYVYDKDYQEYDKSFSDKVSSGGEATSFTVQVVYEF